MRCDFRRIVYGPCVCVSVWDIFPRKEERFRLPPRGRARVLVPYLLTDSSKIRNKKAALHAVPRASVLGAIVCGEQALPCTLQI